MRNLCNLQDVNVYVMANFVALFTSTQRPPLVGDWSHVFDVFDRDSGERA